MGTHFPIYVYETIFGIPNAEQDNFIKRLNFILLCANYYIYKNKKAESNLDLYEFLHDIKMRLEFTKEYMYTNGKQVKFDTLWLELYDKL
jgi:hypothetical protein